MTATSEAFHQREHRGTFAEGQCRDEHHPEAATRGDFAKGLEHGRHAHEGTFAEGQAEREHDPRLEGHGRYAGRRDATAVRSD